jgi:hypothetical protein
MNANNIILGLAISGVIFGTLGVFALAKAAGKPLPKRTIKVGSFPPFESRKINERLALGLMAQESHKNKRK